jgi:hypothetical protein
MDDYRVVNFQNVLILFRHPAPSMDAYHFPGWIPEEFKHRVLFAHDIFISLPFRHPGENRRRTVTLAGESGFLSGYHVIDKYPDRAWDWQFYSAHSVENAPSLAELAKLEIAQGLTLQQEIVDHLQTQKSNLEIVVVLGEPETSYGKECYRESVIRYFFQRKTKKSIRRFFGMYEFSPIKVRETVSASLQEKLGLVPTDEFNAMEMAKRQHVDPVEVYNLALVYERKLDPKVFSPGRLGLKESPGYVSRERVVVLEHIIRR